MTEDWAAVSAAIRKRVNELGWRQRELAERSHVSQAIVREIQHHTVERKRSERTLEALSIALGWHPGHLSAVLNHHRPPKRGDSDTVTGDSTSLRLASVESQLRDVTEQLTTMNATLTEVVNLLRKDR